MSAQTAAQALHDCGYIAAEDVPDVAKIIAQEAPAEAKLREALDIMRREFSEQTVAWGHPDSGDPDVADYYRKWATFAAQAINA